MHYTKNASFREAMISPQMIAALAVPAIGLGAEIGTGQIRRMMEARSKTRAFKTMMEASPHLKREDAVNTHRYFNTLYTVAPELAKEPTVAGAYVATQHAQNLDGGIPHSGVLGGVQSMAAVHRAIGGQKSPTDVYGRATGMARDLAGAFAQGLSFTGALEEQKEDLKKGVLRFNRAKQEDLEDRAHQLDQQHGFSLGKVLQEGVEEAYPGKPGVRRRKRPVVGFPGSGVTYRPNPNRRNPPPEYFAERIKERDRRLQGITKKSSPRTLRDLLGI